MSFSLAAVLATLTGLSYAELSSFIPKAGGEYYYTQRAFGRLVAFMVTWLLLVGLAVASGAVALGFGGYAQAIFHGDAAWFAVGLIVAIAAILYFGIRQAAWVAAACTILELIGLFVVIGVGLPELGTVDYFEMPQGIGGVSAAAALIFFAYIGFEEIVQLSEETKSPTTTIPRAVLLSILITTVLYVLVAIASVSVLGWDNLGASSSPLADVASATLGSEAFLALSVIALFSAGNTVLILLLAAARLLYGMAEDKSLPGVFAKVHARRNSPHVATFTVAGVGIFMIIALQNIEVVASVTTFAFFVTFIVVNGSVIALRYREPEVKRHFRMPINWGELPLLAVAGILSAVFMMFNIELTAIMCGIGLTLAGLIVFTVQKGAKSAQGGLRSLE